MEPLGDGKMSEIIAARFISNQSRMTYASKKPWSTLLLVLLVFLHVEKGDLVRTGVGLILFVRKR